MTDPANALPLDEAARIALAAQGLDYAVLDTGGADGTAAGSPEAAAHERWLQAYHRGFHFEALSPEQLAEYRAALAGPRTVGVWDATAAEAEHPIATVASWRSPLSLGETAEGEARALEGWAISLVSVAATHRRRGIANALLEGELRAAHAAGLPMAMLTVSEATIYGRWGFGPAASIADLRIDARGLRFTAPLPSGRVHRVSTPSLRAVAPELARRAAQRRGGDVPQRPLHWDRLLGLSTRTAARANALRAVRYDDERGQTQGFAVYSLAANPRDFADHTLTVEYLCAATDDALVALWHYLLDHDLVATVVAALRPIDEPLPWMLADPRAVHTTGRREHLWLRVLDAPAALTARPYAVSGSALLRVSDPLGFAAGDWMLEVGSDGAATVTAASARAAEHPSPGTPVVALDVAELGSLLLGGTSAETLHAAGRIAERSPGAAAQLDTLLRVPRAPYLGYWF
ncbi:MAG: GNAT family N-acetyltransferase [Microcella sp.]|jgi:predicted acetyltransferase